MWRCSSIDWWRDPFKSSERVLAFETIPWAELQDTAKLCGFCELARRAIEDSMDQQITPIIPTQAFAMNIGFSESGMEHELGHGVS